jgi:hypothetical protein
MESLRQQMTEMEDHNSGLYSELEIMSKVKEANVKLELLVQQLTAECG